MTHNPPPPQNIEAEAWREKHRDALHDLTICGHEIAELSYLLPGGMENLVMRERWLGQLLRQLKD